MIESTLFASFGQYKGEASLVTLLENIRSGVYRQTIDTIRQALAGGEKKKAANLKKTLLAFTVSATYDHLRKDGYIKTYHPLVILDVDHVGTERLARLLPLVRAAPYTVASFISPSGDGMKIIAYAATTTEKRTPHDHKRTYESVRRWYAGALGVEFDTSGSDVGRLCFVSYDPDLYLSPHFRPWLEGTGEPPAGLPPLPSATPEPDAHAPRKGKATPLEKAFRRAKARGAYQDGNRNNFVFQMAAHANRLEVSKEEMMAYADRAFADLDTDERAQAIDSAYSHTEEHGSAVQNAWRKGKQVDVDAIEGYIGTRFILRKNLVRGIIEVKGKKKPGTHFEPVTDYWENSLWRMLQKDGLTCCLTDLRAIVHSDFSPAYHPFERYFGGLAAWDGTRDWIGELAATIVTTRPAFWVVCLRKWLIAAVACALRTGVENHAVLLLSGEQGLGKTTWLRHLVPPELSRYVFSGNLDPTSKDSSLMLSDCFLIILDELSGQSRPEQNKFKAMITMDAIRERRAYARNAETYPRRASFAATVNDNQVLTDRTGSRRFLCFEAISIDYTSPVNHAGVYAQALALLNAGEKYWFSDQEVAEINDNNESFQLNSPEEELFYTYFRKPERFDTVQYLTSSDIVTKIAQNTHLSVSSINTNNLGKMLKRHGFEQKKKGKRRTYTVFEYAIEQVKANFMRADTESTESDPTGYITENKDVDPNPSLPF